MMSLDFAKMHWNCMVCGDLRPDAAISVEVHEVEYDGRIIPGAAYNQKYCNDRPDCVAAAKTPGPYRLGGPKCNNARRDT